MSEDKEKQESKPVPPTPAKAGFTKEQFLQSRKTLPADKDILAVVLEEGKRYTVQQAEKAVHDFKKRKVT
ncbi:hypothetical protein DUZ99_02005 [Xylanibacillus composti]|uniref:Uncharacterized protein n=1 Tax=Xylanibacillus composti TaxID=1572762 RepID=A0A8J4M448_9BACL|nr:hypothetical protein [Xylanibacillus composti]MDT9723768.1 hypothetical protein [Xylanibacillus composti]GIQ70762.1 hypothetical protein XYCOK13_35860 [Xylanibacillus composti]